MFAQYERLSDHKNRLNDEVVRLRAVLTLDPETAGRLWHEVGVARGRCAPISHTNAIHHGIDQYDALAFLAALRAHAGLDAVQKM